MRPHREIQQEAERLVVLGREYLAERRALAADGTVVGMPRTLARLPDSFVTAAPAALGDSEGATRQHRQRHIEADIEKDELLFRLIERENDLAADGRVLREGEPEVVMFSRSGFDLLLAGYELVEEERLGEALAPYSDREDSRAEADPEAVAEVEEILETSELPVADRMRAKAEIVEFLAGRLEANEFIEHAIDRQRLREVCVERQERRPEMRLTVNSD
ncbi:MAG TPA: hypothetical protein VG936_10770 [Lacunisphaera sp.]|nr:hypothetical protein [Lacunisphaera sp.]